MSSSRTLSRKFRTSFTCIKPRFDPSIILLYIAASVEQYYDITRVDELPENERILEGRERTAARTRPAGRGMGAGGSPRPVGASGGRAGSRSAPGLRQLRFADLVVGVGDADRLE